MMEKFNTRHLERAVIVLLTIIPLVHNWKQPYPYEKDAEKLEQMFMDLHPDVNNIQWPQLDKMLQKTHRNICDEVYRSVQPYYDEYIYLEEYPVNPEEKSKRIRGPDLLEMKKEMLAIPIVECIYKQNVSLLKTPRQNIMYLTHADNTHVFTLRKDQFTDIFYLETGLHPVSWE